MTKTFNWEKVSQNSELKRFRSLLTTILKQNALMANITTSEYFKNCFSFQKKTWSLGNFYSYPSLKGLQDWFENFT